MIPGQAAAMLDTDSDCQALQEDLTSFYGLAVDVNMTFNADKFDCLRFWPGKVSKPDGHYFSPDSTPIEEKLHLRDLGLEISSDLTFLLRTQ